MNRREFIVGATSLAALASTARLAHAESVPAGYPADYGAIIEGSKAENNLLMYTNMSVDRWEGVNNAFKAKYPWINIQNLDGNSADIFERFLAENGSGAQSADLLVNVGPANWIDLSEKGLIEPYVSPEAAAYPESMRPLPGIYTIIADPILLMWNKATLPAERVPTGIADLVEKVKANPSVFNGKMVTYPAHTSSFGYTLHYAFAKKHGDAAWAWYDVLGPQSKVESSAGTMVEKLTAGEYNLIYFCGSGSGWPAVRDPARAELLGWSFIADGTPLMPRPGAVSSKAKNPNAAKLMLDFLLSHEGQATFGGNGRMVVRPDVTSADVGGEYTYSSVVEQVGDGNAIVIDYDRDQVDDYNAFLQRWKAAYKIT